MNFTLSQKIKQFIETNFSFFEESQSEYSVYCPFHNNTNTPALYINKHTGLWHCFNESCGKKGHIGQLAEHFNIDLGIQRAIPKDISVEDLIDSLVEKEEFSATWDEALDRISLNYNIKNDTEKLNYLINRGFHPSVLKHFEIGYSDVQNRIVIPTRDDAFKLVGFIGRAIDEDRKPKYKYSDGFPRSSILFNLNNAKYFSEVYITEGSLDAIKIHQAGFPNVISTIGSNVNKGQVDLINKYFNDIVILSDNDAAGEAMKRDIIEGCPRLNIWVVKYPEGIKDPGEMDDEQIRNLILTKLNYLDYLFETTFNSKEKIK